MKEKYKLCIKKKSVLFFLPYNGIFECRETSNEYYISGYIFSWLKQQNEKGVWLFLISTIQLCDYKSTAQP